MADVVEVILALKNVSRFVSDARAASGAVGQVGTEAEKSGKKAGIGWKGMAKWAGGAAAIYGATRYIKGAVTATEDLAKNTLTLQRTTGMETEAASEWAALTKERGIATKQFQMGLKTLSTQMEKTRGGTVKEAATVAALRKQIDAVAAAGGKKAPAQLAKLSRAIATAQGSGKKAREMMKTLGVSITDVAKGDTQAVLLSVADAFKTMKNPAERAALASKLFGRSGLALLPILMKGRQGVLDMLQAQKDSGNYLGGKNIDDTKKLIDQQRELKRSLSGVKIQLGVALLPVLISVGKMLVALARIMRPLTKNALLFKIAIAALVTAFVAYKIAMIAAAIATGVFETAALPVVLVVLAIAAGIAALIVVGYLLYKHWDELAALAGRVWDSIKKGALWVFNWLKENWPLVLGVLAGPFGLAIGLVIKHFDAIKETVLNIVATIRRAIQHLVEYVTSLPDKVGGILEHIPGVKQAEGVVGAGRSALGHIGLAGGGHVTRAGSFLVGERGPELVGLPRGSAVTPLQGPTFQDETSRIPGRLEIIVPVMLDGREIARSNARITANDLARR